MNRILSLILILVFMIGVLSSAFAADVSGYEANAPIDLTPFKSDKYVGRYNALTNSAYLRADGSIVVLGANVLWLTIRMETVEGYELFVPFIEHTFLFDDPDIYIMIGGNRYRCVMGLQTSQYHKSLPIDKKVYGILKEIVESQTGEKKYDVYITHQTDLSKAHKLTEEEISFIAGFIEDLDISTLSEQLFDDLGNVTTITSFN